MSMRLKWEKDSTLAKFPVISGPPFRLTDRKRLAEGMSYDQILQTNVKEEDGRKKRLLRWKYMRCLSDMLRGPLYASKSFENALNRNSHYQITADHFVMSLSTEFKFPSAKIITIDKQLRLLYFSFDDHQQNQVDWRNIISYYRLLIYFRFVQERPSELILLMTDVYGNFNRETENNHRDDLLIPHASQVLTDIFHVPCIDDTDVLTMNLQLQDLLEVIQDKGNNIIRRNLEIELKHNKYEKLLSFWSHLAWQCLSTEQRLCVLDEKQVRHMTKVDSILEKFQLTRAVYFHSKHLYQFVFKAWKLITIRQTGARVYAILKFKRKSRKLLLHWKRIARQSALKRRRRILAEVMGCYAIKARVFLAIKVFVIQSRRIARITGNAISNQSAVHQLRLASTHLRLFYRLRLLRLFVWKWKIEIYAEKNVDKAEKHDFHRRLAAVFKPWRKIAHENQLLHRQEMIVRENKLAFDRMMEETEKAGLELLQLENERNERREKQLQEIKAQEREQRLMLAKQQAQLEKRKETDYLLQLQYEKRTQRIKQEMNFLKAQFRINFEYQAQEHLNQAKNRTIAFIENPENKLAIDLKFSFLKREFYANPTPETREKERFMASYKHILFLFIDAKLKADNLDLRNLIPPFDKGGKGYLNYGEFASLIRSLKTNLNESQISSVTRLIDRDKDGFIDLQELQVCLEEVNHPYMGAPGSPWKLYIDPLEDVICYHNFLTHEKILEYQMTDRILRQIVIANLYGEAEHIAQLELTLIKKDQWKLVLQDYMIRRLQSMFRRWKGRKYRDKVKWKLQQRVQKAMMKSKLKVANFIACWFRGFKCRDLFRRQLLLTIERVWDVDSATEFYYNHATSQSSWDQPGLLRRCKIEDLTPPCIWVPLFDANEQHNSYVESVKGGWFTTEDETTTGKTVTFSNSQQEQIQLEQEEQALTLIAMGNENEYNNNNDSESMALIPAVNCEEQNQQLTTWQPQSQQAEQASRYWHVTGKKEFPRKPDGYPPCCICRRLLAVHTCLDCQLYECHFCFGCHRQTHGNPFGFLQRAKAKRKQYSDPDFVHQLYNFQHRWEDTKPISCELCKGKQRMFAAYYCEQDNKHLCRDCFRRTHSHDMKPPHRYYSV